MYRRWEQNLNTILIIYGTKLVCYTAKRICTYNSRKATIVNLSCVRDQPLPQLSPIHIIPSCQHGAPVAG